MSIQDTHICYKTNEYNFRVLNHRNSADTTFTVSDTPSYLHTDQLFNLIKSERFFFFFFKSYDISSLMSKKIRCTVQEKKMPIILGVVSFTLNASSVTQKHALNETSVTWILFTETLYPLPFALISYAYLHGIRIISLKKYLQTLSEFGTIHILKCFFILIKGLWDDFLVFSSALDNSICQHG